MIGIQFQEIGGGAKALATAGVLDDQAPGIDDEGTAAIEMMVWDGSDYTRYGWSGTSMSEIFDIQGLDNQWLDDQLEPTDEVQAAGSAAWVKSSAAATMTVSGEVPTADSVQMPISIGYNMVANPYPGNAPVATFGTLSADAPGIDDEGTAAIEMMVWDGSDYTRYGWSGTSMSEIFDIQGLDNQWLDDQLEPTDATIAFGHGVWIKSTAATTITFKNPAK